MLSSCGGHEDYDAYIGSLKEQAAAIDTISTPVSYADCLDRISESAAAFEQLGIKLNDTQKAELEALSVEIQQKLTEKYNKMAQTPMLIEETVLDAEAPVEAVGDAEVLLEGK